MFRTLKEFRQVQAEIPAPKPEPTEPEIPGELGSCLPDVPEEDEEESDVDLTVPKSPPDVAPTTVEAPEVTSKAEEIDDR